MNFLRISFKSGTYSKMFIRSLRKSIEPFDLNVIGVIFVEFLMQVLFSDNLIKIIGYNIHTKFS